MAQTQAQLIQAQLEEFTGERFQIKTIKTEGDGKTDVPLWQLEGKDFFTKELDSALLSEEVDLTIHSYKDLGHERPPGIALAAITERTYGEDILLLTKNTQSKISSLSRFIVGTSSPRRIANAKRHLAPLLPVRPPLEIQCKTLRGNINTRIEKLLAGQYDGIILALAGIERLACHRSSQEKIQKLLRELDYMILPSSLFPSAAAQGALAVEIKSGRNDGGELQKKLQKLHHLKTEQLIRREREHFQYYGGGCHLAVGIQVEEVSGHILHFQQGEVDGKEVAQNFIEGIPPPPLSPPFFVGLPPEKNPRPGLFLSDQLIVKAPIPVKERRVRQCCFVTSLYCLEALEKTYKGGSAIFSGGLKTWKALAERGYWANGSSDGLGHGKIHQYLKSRGLALFHGELSLVIYSSRHVRVSPSIQGELVPCYEHQIGEVGEEYLQKVRSANSFFWTSYRQFESFCEHLEDGWWHGKRHCCGLGKTFQEFKERDLEVTPFINLEQYVRTCLKGPWPVNRIN